jgi:hypothetical protein
VAISPALLKNLGDAIGDAFEMPELDGLVLRSTGAGLFKEWVPEGQPHRVTAYKLLVALQERGLEVLFLAHVLASRPAPDNGPLRALVTEACPAAETTKIDVRTQVPGVVAGLVAAHAKLADPQVRAALATTRDSLEVVAREIDTLEVYKNLHECLHQLQIKAFPELRAAAKQFPGNSAKRGYLREHEEEISISSTRARGWVDRLSEGAAARRAEIQWIDRLETAASKFQAGLMADDVAGTLTALNDVRQVVRYEPFRLSRLIDATAEDLPLDQLTNALRSAADALGATLPELAALHASVRNLRATLRGRVVEHKLWQDADNQIWNLEETLEHAQAAAPEDFILTWPTAKAAIRSLAEMDPNTTWSKQSAALAVRIDDELASEGTGPGFQNDFDAYRRVARTRFFGVDAQLKADCAALARLSAPLHDILEDLKQ